MPFDFAAEPNIGRERLRTLATMLRDPEEMRDWVWDYGDSETCALGLACARMGLVDTGDHCARHFFEIDQGTVEYIFFNGFMGYSGAGEFMATPLHVAEAIDAYLAEPVQLDLVLA